MLRTRILLALGAGVPAALFVTAVVLLAIRIWAEWQHLPGHRVITADTFRLADPHPDRRVARAVAGVWREWSRELFLAIALAGLWPVVRLMPWQGLLGRIGRRDLARRGSAGWIGRARLRRAGMLTRTPLAAPRPLIACLPGGFFTGPRWVMPPADEPHVFVCAPTGAGKSTGIAIPTLLGLTGSAIVLDVKDGELMRLTAARRRAMGQRVLLFAPWRDAPVPDGIDVLTFNPLDRVTDETDGEVRYARAAQLAAALVPDARDSTQSWIPFARRLAGAAMLGAVALHALARRSRGVRDRDGMLHEAGIDPAALGALAACPAPTLGHAHDLLLTGGPVRGGPVRGGQAEGGQAQDGQAQDDPVNVRARYARVARALDRIVAADPDTRVWLGPAVREFTQAAGMDARPLSSYLSILLGPGLGAWADPRIDRATATTTKGFSFAGMRRRPATLYLGVGVNDMAGLGQLMRVMFEQAILALQDGPEAASGSADTGAADTGAADTGAADTGAADGRGTVTLMLDEFPQLGAMSVLLGAIRTLRAYGGRVVIIVQALPDLAAIYGPEGAGLLRNNCGVQVYTAPADIETARAVSAALGERGVVSRSAALSGPLGTGGGHTASETAVSVPLMRPDEVLRLPGDDLIVLVRRRSPARLARIAWFRDPPFRDLRPGDGSAPGGETGSSRARAMRWQRAVRRIRTFAGQAFADSLPLPLAGASCGILAFVLWQVWQDGPASLATVAGQARAWLSGGETPPAAAALAAEAMDWAGIGLLTGCAGAILRVAWLDRWFMRRAAGHAMAAGHATHATDAAAEGHAMAAAEADQGEDTETVETGAGAAGDTGGEAGARPEEMDATAVTARAATGGPATARPACAEADAAPVASAGADTPVGAAAGADAPGASALAVVVVAGDRDWEDVATVHAWLDRARAALRERYGADMVLCHGGAPTGLDAIAADWALSSGVPQLVAGADRDGGGAGDEPEPPAPDALPAFAAAEGAGPVRGVIGFGGSEPVLAFLRAAEDRGLRSVHVPEGDGNSADRRGDDGKSAGSPAAAGAAGEGEGLLVDAGGMQGEAGAGGAEVVLQDGAADPVAEGVQEADAPCPSGSVGDDAGDEGDPGPVPGAAPGAARDGLPVLANPPGPGAPHGEIAAALRLIPQHVSPTTHEVAAWLGWIPAGAKCPRKLGEMLYPAFTAADRESTKVRIAGLRQRRWVFTGKPDQDDRTDQDG